MDSTAPEIVFMDEGCNFCTQALKSLEENKSLVLPNLKSKGKYDVLIGLSGGVDSSFVLHKAVEMGLRPLCFSVDNGWNDPKADENILRMVETLKVPFYRYTIDIPKFRELQAAFMKQGQKNIEIPTDHILLATTYEMADKYGIKYVLGGGNSETESIMPESWGYQPRDLVHIKDVYKKTFHKKLTGLPVCGLLKWNWYKWVKGIKVLNFLDYIPYNRSEAIKLLKEKYGYQEYGDKHQESFFTWWFQNFYLYEKFGIDKRKAHYSSLIVSGQMTREEAMEQLTTNPVYPKLGIEERVLKYTPRPYTDFKTDEKLFSFISSLIRFIRKHGNFT